MKKYRFLFFLFLFLFQSGFTIAQYGYKFGLRAGVNISRTDISYLSSKHSDFSIRPDFGFGGGLLFHYGLQKEYLKNISVRSAILFQYKKSKIILDDKDFQKFSKNIVSMPIEIPLLISMRTPIGNKLFLRGSTGFGFDYQLQQDAVDMKNDTVNKPGGTLMHSLSYNAGIHSQVGVSVKGLAEIEWENAIGTRLFSIGLSYTKGLIHEVVGNLSYNIRFQDTTANSQLIDKSYNHYIEFNGSYVELSINYYFNAQNCCPFLDNKNKPKKQKREWKKEFQKSSTPNIQ